MNNTEERDFYIIPRNFIDEGTFMGGALKVRNTIEAVVLALLIAVPVINLPLSLTVKITILCLTALPFGMLALIGVAGESLTSFVFGFFKFLVSRRVLYRGDCIPQSKRRGRQNIKRKPSPPPNSKKKKAGEPVGKANTLEQYLPYKKVEHGVLYTKDGRYLKILEVEPINFLLRSTREQRNIIYSFVSYLKICPVRLQVKVVSKRADINRHLDGIRKEMAEETDAKCRLLQQDYIQLIQQIGSREAVTRRFFLIFEYEPFAGSGRRSSEGEAIANLETAARTARTYLQQCGNFIVEHEDENQFTTEVLYGLLNRNTSTTVSIADRLEALACRYFDEGTPEKLEQVSLNELVAPESIDYTHGDYVLMDGVYHGYLLVPSGGYKSRVSAGWLSLLINAGEGIDLDIFWTRQPKERVQQKLGQQLRINRTKLREASDTNTDFESLEGAIRSGYFLKDGLSNNEDFYYMNLVVTVTASSKEELDWRVSEVRKLMISQDMDVMRCTFRQESALLSILPDLTLDKKLYAKSKRNVLTLGVASCYPFVSFEMSDEGGILLGVNNYNNSLVISDFFNSQVYKNANIAIMGCTGAGKTYLLQLIALRFRRRHIQTFILAPIKGHEMRRACTNIGGEFIQISPASPNCINVMAIRKVDHSNTDLLDGPAPARSELAAKIQQLHIFFSLLIPDISHEERQLLDEALVRTYAAAGITHDNSSLVDEENPEKYRRMPILGDLHEILRTAPETRRIANILNRLVNGSAKSFNQQTNVDLDNLYTVLDLSDLTGDLLPVGMFVALDLVWDKVKEDRTKEKAVICDELWEIIGASSNRYAANFALEVFKLIRGFGGSGICATQDLNDFFALDDGTYGRGIINACKTKIVLNLEDEEAQRVQNILRLSESEIMAVTHFERGSGLVIANNNNIAVEFRSSQLEKELITTDRRELLELLAHRQTEAG